MLGAPHEQPIFTPAFTKSVIFPGANRVSAAFQLRFSCVSVAFQLRFSSLEVFFLRLLFLWSQNIRVPQSQTFGQTFFFVFHLRFNWQKRGAHPLNYGGLGCARVSVTTKLINPRWHGSCKHAQRQLEWHAVGHMGCACLRQDHPRNRLNERIRNKLFI